MEKLLINDIRIKNNKVRTNNFIAIKMTLFPVFILLFHFIGAAIEKGGQIPKCRRLCHKVNF